MEALKAEFDRVLTAKAERRRRLAALPFMEKVRILVAMQRMTAPLTLGRDPRARIWTLPPGESGVKPSGGNTAGPPR